MSRKQPTPTDIHTNPNLSELDKMIFCYIWNMTRNANGLVTFQQAGRTYRVEVGRGQVIVKVASIAKSLGIDRKKITKSIETLSKWYINMDIKGMPYGCLITWIDYDEIVKMDNNLDNSGTSSGHQMDNSGTAKYNDKKEKNEKEGKKKFTTVDDFYQDIIEGDYIDKLCPDIDHKRLKNRIVVCLDWRKKEKKQVTIPKTAITKRLKDRDGNRNYEKKKIEYVPKTEEEILNAPLEDN